ncbi:MAG: hypothetical protein RLO81_09720 [Fulvivirga sp.]|uniref:hypothetical protein n=1 Tax=Fulvivirga sp. TaxID=1931237 RepID=UPI0032EDF7D9
MKSILKYTLLLILLYSCTRQKADAQTVYITKTGSKYHTESCRYLSHSKYPISLKDAKIRAIEACKVCKPPTAVTGEKTKIDSSKVIDPPKRELKAVASQCSATAKTTGNRCKRMTKNASGKCWQHE